MLKSCYIYFQKNNLVINLVIIIIKHVTNYHQNTINIFIIL